MVKWAKKAYGYFEEFGLPNMPEEEREKAQKFLGGGNASGGADGQGQPRDALPGAGRRASWPGDRRQTHQQATSSSRCRPRRSRMPMVEPAIVVGVSDAKLLQEGPRRVSGDRQRTDRRRTPDQGQQRARERPDPRAAGIGNHGGTIYSFPLPEQWGVDKQIVPNIGVSEQVAVLSASQQHTERLLKATPLAVGGVLGQDRATAGRRRLVQLGRVDRGRPLPGWILPSAGHGLQRRRRGTEEKHG